MIIAVKIKVQPDIASQLRFWLSNSQPDMAAKTDSRERIKAANVVDA